MKSLLLAPHADDETLFAAYTCLRERPFIICCFNQDRGHEFFAAVSALGCHGTIFGLPDSRYDADQLARHLELYVEPEVVWAPAIEPRGHEDHNLVGEVAHRVYGDRVRSYLTYAPRGQRSTWGKEVDDVEAHEVSWKLRALSCYLSQIDDPSTRPWFTSLLDLREWTE